MDVIEIIKDAFMFPSQNIKLLLIYELIAIVGGVFCVCGAIAYLLGFISPEFFMWGGMAIIVSVLLGWLMHGYLISVIKSGIDLDDEVPEFELWKNFNSGFDNFIVTIVYFIIPAFITLIVGYITDIYGNLILVAQGIFMQATDSIAGSSFIVSDVMSQAIANLMVSLVTTVTVAVVVFVIFSFIQTMAQARLANTGSLCEALNVFEATKDIKRIGIGKVIIVVLLIIIITAVIEIIFSAIYSYVPILSILSLIITPYLVFFAQRAVGLLYSDIA